MSYTSLLKFGRRGACTAFAVPFDVVVGYICITFITMRKFHDTLMNNGLAGGTRTPNITGRSRVFYPVEIQPDTLFVQV